MVKGSILDLPTQDCSGTTTWQGCCRLAYNLRHKPDQWKLLQNGLAIPQVTDKRLLDAAIELIKGMEIAEVRRWDWLPAPSDEDLAQPEAWAARRLVERRAEQDAAEDDQRVLRKAARAFGLTTPGTGTINPVHLQKSKLSLKERLRRLQWTMDQHGDEFEPKRLDHRSPFYISQRDGGISNKQIIITANDIVEQNGGQRAPRSYDENWKIVMDEMLHQKAEQPQGT